MEISPSKIWVFIVLRFLLKSKVLKQTLAHEFTLSTDTRQFNDQLSSSLKQRLQNFGSLGGPQSNNNTGAATNHSHTFGSTHSHPTTHPHTNLHSFTSTRDASPSATASHSAAGDYQPRQYESFNINDFENFMTKMGKQELDRCATVPHDFVLVIDESGSISTYNWKSVVKNFVMLIASAIAHINTDNNLSIVQYSQMPKLVMHPRKMNKATFGDVSKVIESMFEARRTHGTTFTGTALEFVRENILDPTGKFVLELSESTEQMTKKNQIVILMTDGGAKDSAKAIKESLIHRFNGVDLFVFGIGNVNNEECKKLVGCSQTGECKNFVHATWDSVLHYLHELILTMCKDSGRNATCLEEWSDFSECSVECGGGFKTSRFLGFKTVSPATTGSDGSTGLTCEEQYKDVQDKVVSCNNFPCPDNLMEVNEHKITRDSAEVLDSSQDQVGDLKTVTYGTDDHVEETHDLPETSVESDIRPTVSSYSGLGFDREAVYKRLEERQERERQKRLEEEQEKERERQRLLQEERDKERERQLQEDAERERERLQREKEEEARKLLEEAERENQRQLQEAKERERLSEALEDIETSGTHPILQMPAVKELEREREEEEREREQETEGPKKRTFSDIVNDYLYKKRAFTPKTNPEPEEEDSNLVDTATGEDEPESHPEPEPEQKPTARDQYTQTKNVRHVKTQTPHPPHTHPPRSEEHNRSLNRDHPEAAKANPPATDQPNNLQAELAKGLNNLKAGAHHVEHMVTGFKGKLKGLLENDHVRKLAAVAIVILLSAISISVFSYIFLREKEPSPHLFDPSDQEFMNAGDGDDVEPTENYQVSNMEDGIWA